ncbi:MAG: glycosyltransferase [Candidatus Aenigmatarchaeota archaeon]
MTAEKYTEITIIIPTYNRASVLKRCLEAFFYQNIPAESYEVIVSDDGSTDDTKKVTEEASTNAPFSIRYLWQPNRGANAARNNAIHASYGKLLLFINDDTIPVPEMLEEHLKTHTEYPEENVAVLGRMTISPEVPYSIFAKLHLDANFGLWEGKRELNWLAFYTCNVSVKKSFLLKYGLFEESIRYHEDVELSERLSRYGLKIIYNPSALGYHYHFLTEEDYLNVAKKDGIALAKWYKKSPHLKKELAMLDFPLFVPFYKKFKYLIGDIIFCRITRPFFIQMARYLQDKSESLSLMIYRKLYQAIKREAIREELKSS